MVRNFCGFVTFEGIDDEEALPVMLDKLNLNGHYSTRRRRPCKNIYFGECIVDLKNGHPMFDSVADSNSDVYLSCYALLTNREELFKALDIVPSERFSNEALILTAYKKWGKACVEKLEGDWAFALWDDAIKELILASSKTGELMLYYTVLDQKMYFSTLFSPLPYIPGINLKLDKSKLVADLCEHHSFEDRTVFEEIRFIPQGHLLIFKKGTAPLIKQYWNVKDIPEKLFSKDEEYIEAFYDVYNTNTQKWLDLPLSWEGTLSGGLDSSSMSYLVSNHHKYKDQGFKAYSYVPYFNNFDDLNPTKRTGEKKELIDSIVSHIPALEVSFFKKDPSDFLTYLTSNFDVFGRPPVSSNYWWIEELCKKSSESGVADGLLGGEGGNTTISYEGVSHAASLGQYLNDINTYGGFSVSEKVQLFGKSLLKEVLNIAKTSSLAKDILIKKYLNHKTFLREDFIDDADGKSVVDTHLYNSNRDFLPSLRDRYNLYTPYHARFGLWSEIAAKYGLVYCNVPRSTPIVEFIASMPNSIFRRGNETKYLYRRTFKGKLPDEVVFNPKKALQVSDIVQILRHNREALHSTIETIRSSALCQEILDFEKMDVFFSKLLDYDYFDESFAYEVVNKSITISYAMWLVWLESPESNIKFSV